MITVEDAKQMNLPSGSGMFSDLFNVMNNEIKRNTTRKTKYGKRDEYGEAANMTPGEKKISFLNRYFIYKKIRSVDAEKVSYDLLGVTKSEVVEDEKKDEIVQNIVEEATTDMTTTTTATDVSEKTMKPISSKKAVTKKKRKLVLKKK